MFIKLQQATTGNIVYVNVEKITAVVEIANYHENATVIHMGQNDPITVRDSIQAVIGKIPNTEISW